MAFIEVFNSAFINTYTKKQWKNHPKFLPSSIFNRLPIRLSYNEDYYEQTQWQGIPKNGYTDIFRNLLKNKNIKVALNKKYSLTTFKSFIISHIIIRLNSF